jgi:lipopolysaccharide export LptBFGC system permease protein LptF
MIINMNTENKSKTSTEWSSREMGALWRKSGNTDYLTGHFKTTELGQEVVHKVVIFANKNKKDNERAPDLIIYKSKPNNATESQQVEPQAVAATASSEDEVPDNLF